VKQGSGEFGARHISLRHRKAQYSRSSVLHRCGIHVLSKYSQHLEQSGVGVEVGEDTAVVLLAKVIDEESQSTNMLFPSSSSSERGARVQAGPGVSLLSELLLVTDVVSVFR
jgi:hypothetical protein